MAVERPGVNLALAILFSRWRPNPWMGGGVQGGLNGGREAGVQPKSLLHFGELEGLEENSLQ